MLLLLFTFLTSFTWLSIDKFRCITPRPPAFDSAIAIFASVTVSMADDINGIFNLNFWPKSVFVMASEGKMDEKLGIKVTSSKVS